MKNCGKCRKIFIALIILFIITAIFIFLPQKLFAATLFGGMIQKMNICVIPPGIYLKLGGPVGGDFVYQIGKSLSYLFSPPIHIGQWLLGVAGGQTLCCLDRKCRKQITGNSILFHGSSF